jgi:hypothetical protein
MVHGHHDVARHAAEAGLELDELVAQLQAAGGLEADVEHDLVVLHVLHRHLHGDASTCTATYGVKPLSVHQSCSARIR